MENLEINKENIAADSIIGINNSFSGEFISNGLLRIDGDFKGTIKGYGKVLVGEGGRIQGDIYAKSIRIGGKIKGNVYALERVDILATGKLIGDLYTKAFCAEEGMFLKGLVQILPEEKLKKIFDENVNNSKPIIENDF